MIVRETTLLGIVLVAGAACAGPFAAPARGAEEQDVNRTIIAEVVAFDQPFLWNRLGASQPGGMIYALRRDVASRDGGAELKPGRVMLRPGKRPRPLVLRANVGDRLKVRFTNLLAPTPVNGSAATRYAGVHVQGLDAAAPVGAAGGGGDGSWVGRNPNGLAAPGESRDYEYFAKAEGTYLLTNAADNVDNGQSADFGLFGAVNVQPEWAEWYRSQVTREDLIAATQTPPPTPTNEGRMATPRIQRLDRQYARPAGGARNVPRTPRRQMVRGDERDVYTLSTTIPDKRAENRTDVVIIGGRLYTMLDQPILNYNALYKAGPSSGVPVLKMLRTVRGPEQFTTEPTTFPAAKVEEAVEAFNATGNFVTDDLRQVFAARGLPLSRRVRISEEDGTAWLLTEPGVRIHLVERIEAAGGAAFRVSDASLHLAHSDLTAAITGPRADRFAYELNSPAFFNNPTIPDRRQPYREFTIIYHRSGSVVQAFSNYLNSNTQSSLAAGQDGFAINYGMAGIGSEILASRLGVGPMGNADAVDLKYEEFFLSSWAVGDPAMVVDVPANANDQAVTNPDDGSEPEQKPLFSLDEVETQDGLMTALGVGRVPQKLLDAFAAGGVRISDRSFVATVAPLNQWVILDPFSPDGATTPGRKRYPIVRRRDLTDHGVVTTTLDAFSGFPARPGTTAIEAFNGPSKARATKAFFPDDPSNVYHSNIRDHVKFRILHAGPGPSHVHHLHAHQWLHSPNSAQSQYLDSQLIVPGASYTLEMVYNGSGNRNMTVGDSIFHCHFYPHFAQGMWSLWRVHDVFEGGTWLDPEGRPVTLVANVDGVDQPVRRIKDSAGERFALIGGDRREIPAAQVARAWNRSLPDGEIQAGTPIPAIVPLPSIAMPLKPAPVRLADLAPFAPPGEGLGRRVEVQPRNAQEIEDAKARLATDPSVVVPEPDYENPGYPFFVPGVAGHRPPHPPKDFAWREDVASPGGGRILLDGGLPRHVVLGGKIVKEYHTRWDFSREFIAYDRNKQPIAGRLAAMELPEDGTPYEMAAMRHHSQRTHSSFLPNGDPGNITRNGVKGKPGAPYAPPEVDDYGNGDFNARRYQAAVIQSDVVLSKTGWHYPQQRFLTLWDDVAPTFGGRRAPQPLFFRSNTNDTIEFWHTNLVPAHYELDDFQVRTPTDVIGQHIHNVKFDVTSSDGGANGFNYEDGTFSPDEVRDRIHAINLTPGLGPNAGQKGLLAFDEATSFVDPGTPPKALAVVPVKEAYPSREGVGDAEFGLFGKPPAGQDWDGAQTTVQRWDTDPLLDNFGEERTLRTIFTHDHLGPSTHQQAGLYAGLVVEPEGSLWYLPDGRQMNRRRDGGPTSWEGYVVTRDPDKSYREFAVEFQDSQLAYASGSITAPSNALFDPARTSTPSALFDVKQYSAIVSQQVPALIQELSTTGLMPPLLTKTVFPAMGVPLTGAETLRPRQGVPGWVLSTDADAELNAGATYILEPRNGNTSLVVFTPDIKPGWTDPANALNPPPTPGGAGPNMGPPYAQLVSAGPVGTYSMNYRNESVISRLAAGPAAGAGAQAAAAPTAAAPRQVAPAVRHGAMAPERAAHGTAAPSKPAAPGRAVDQPREQGERGHGPFAPEVADHEGEAVAEFQGPPAAATIQVDGQIVGGVPTWVVNGTKADNVAVKAGDTIVWRAVTATHGVVFNTQAVAEAVLQFESGGGLPVLGPQTVNGEVAWGSPELAPAGSGSLLARAVVKAGGASGTTLSFFCTRHGRPMGGSLAVAATPPTAPTVVVDGQIVGGVPTWVVNGVKADNVAVKAGDIIAWRAVTATHGVVFDTEAVARAFLDFETGGGLPALGPQVVGAEVVWGSPEIAPAAGGSLLARAVVKASVAPGTMLGFFCTRHGRPMNGSLTTPTAPPPAGATIQVDGQIVSGVPTWLVNGAKADNVTVKAGDTIVWRAVTAPHGVVFDTEAVARAFLDFATGGGLPALGPQTVNDEAVWGSPEVAPAAGGSLLARAVVKAGVAPGTSLGFFCTRHGRPMNGSLVVPGTPPPASTTFEIDGQIVGGVPTWVVNGVKAVGVAVKPGDTVIWRAVTAPHGVVFNTQAEAGAFLDFATGGGLPVLGSQVVGAETVWGTPIVAPAGGGSLLARAVVKPGLAPGTALEFFCTQHGRAMNGSLNLPLTPATDPAFVFNSILRNDPALNVQPTPGSPIASPAATIQVDGQIVGGVPTWVVNGRKAEDVALKPGDTIVWRAVTAPHGVVFDTQAAAEAVLQFESGGGLPVLGPQVVGTETVWGTPIVAPAGGGSLLARAVVKPEIAPGTTLGFFCTRHGRAMNGALTVAYFRFPAYIVNPSTPVDRGGVEPTDPFTPLLRAYANDNVQVRVLVGAHTQAHSFQIQGTRWTFEPDYPNSGYKNAQAMGISEHFEMIFKLPAVGVAHPAGGPPASADYLISPSSSIDGLANGTWSMLRAFAEPVGRKDPGQPPSPSYLAPLPNNPRDVMIASQAALDAAYLAARQKFEAGRAGGEKPPANYRTLNVTATTARKALGGQPLSFNSRAKGAFDRPDALIFVRSEDLDAAGRLKPDAPREPLVLRAAAGDWIEVLLTNALDPEDPAGLPAPQSFAPGTPFGRPVANTLMGSTRQVGLHPALVEYDVTRANGVNVGFNPAATVAPGDPPTPFYWYAGELIVEQGGVRERPVEYGATNLIPADMMVQPQFGMGGTLIVEPKGTEWFEDLGTHASAVVRPSNEEDVRAPFRDFALVGQNLVANLGANSWGAFNYRTEPFSTRGVDPIASSSQLAATRFLEFEVGGPNPALGPVNVVTPANAPPGFVPERLWGTTVHAPAPGMPARIAQGKVRAGLADGARLAFFCTQHGRAMHGELIVQAGANGAAPVTIQIDGTILAGAPSWAVGGMAVTQIPVKPGDTVIWQAVTAPHGVVFDPAVPGLGFAMAFSNDQLTPPADPQTPIFLAAAGMPVRFRLVMPSTSTQRVPGFTFEIHGHGWPEEPYALEGTVIGGWPENPFAVGVERPHMNWRSEFLGAQQILPYEGFNFVIDHAGGRFGVAGDYLYEAYQQTRLRGLWGLFRVQDDLIVVDKAAIEGGKLKLSGFHMPSEANRNTTASVTVVDAAGARSAASVDRRRRWTFEADHATGADATFTVESALGGKARIVVPVATGATR